MSSASPEPLIGVINVGSSYVKFSFYERDRPILIGQVDGIGAHPSASAAGPNGVKARASGSRYKAARRTERGPSGNIAVGTVQTSVSSGGHSSSYWCQQLYR